MKRKLRAFYLLTKPGIVQGNALHALAGALIASRLPIDWTSVFGVVVGTSLVIASACVANNYMDRGIDRRMQRTKKRPSVTGEIALPVAMAYAAFLLLIGFIVLGISTNPIVLLIGIVAYVMYVFVYGWAKRTTVHSTVIGAIPGALPAMAGYTAVTGELTAGAWLIFLLIFTWQMPHFYAIALFRKKDYAAAGLPVLGVVRPFDAVRRHMLFYLLMYATVVTMIVLLKVVGIVAGVILIGGAVYWMTVFYRTDSKDHVKWARSVFGVSLVLSLLLVVSAAINLFIPSTM